MKRNGKSILLLSLAMLLLAGCTKLRYPVRTQLQPLNDSLMAALDGSYRSYPQESNATGGVVLWELLKRRVVNNKAHLATDNFVVLRAASPRRVVASLYKDSVLLATTKLKGHISKDGYFSVRRRIVYRGIPFFLAYTTSKIHLGIDNKQQLIIDTYRSSYGWFLIFSSGNTRRENMVFQRR